MRRSQLVISKIKENLYLSDLPSSEDEEMLRFYGIDVVVTCLSRRPSRKNDVRGVKYYFFPLTDSRRDKRISRYFYDFYDLMMANEGKKVLVHCRAGISRSAALVISFLILADGLTYKKAVEFVRIRREIINPNEGFRIQLFRLYSKKKKKKEFVTSTSFEMESPKTKNPMSKEEQMLMEMGYITFGDLDCLWEKSTLLNESILGKESIEFIESGNGVTCGVFSEGENENRRLRARIVTSEHYFDDVKVESSSYMSPSSSTSSLLSSEESDEESGLSVMSRASSGSSLGVSDLGEIVIPTSVLSVPKMSHDAEIYENRVRLRSLLDHFLSKSQQRVKRKIEFERSYASSDTRSEMDEVAYFFFTFHLGRKKERKNEWTKIAQGNVIQHLKCEYRRLTKRAPFFTDLSKFEDIKSFFDKTKSPLNSFFVEHEGEEYFIISKKYSDVCFSRNVEDDYALMDFICPIGDAPVTAYFTSLPNVKFIDHTEELETEEECRVIGLSGDFKEIPKVIGICGFDDIPPERELNSFLSERVDHEEKFFKTGAHVLAMWSVYTDPSQQQSQDVSPKNAPNQPSSEKEDLIFEPLYNISICEGKEEFSYPSHFLGSKISFSVSVKEEYTPLYRKKTRRSIIDLKRLEIKLGDQIIPHNNGKVELDLNYVGVKKLTLKYRKSSKEGLIKVIERISNQEQIKHFRQRYLPIFDKVRDELTSYLDLPIFQHILKLSKEKNKSSDPSSSTEEEEKQEKEKGEDGDDNKRRIESSRSQDINTLFQKPDHVIYEALLKEIGVSVSLTRKIFIELVQSYYCVVLKRESNDFVKILSLREKLLDQMIHVYTDLKDDLKAFAANLIRNRDRGFEDEKRIKKMMMEEKQKRHRMWKFIIQSFNEDAFYKAGVEQKKDDEERKILMTDVCVERGVDFLPLIHRWFNIDRRMKSKFSEFLANEYSYGSTKLGIVKGCILQTIRQTEETEEKKMIKPCVRIIKKCVCGKGWSGSGIFLKKHLAEEEAEGEDDDDEEEVKVAAMIRSFDTNQEKESWTDFVTYFGAKEFHEDLNKHDEKSKSFFKERDEEEEEEEKQENQKNEGEEKEK